MKKIALYGGAFNPIAKHHVVITNKILEVVDEIIIIPAFKSLYDKQLESGHHRLNMCNIAIKNNNNNKISISDFEITNKLSGTFYDIIKLYLNKYKKENEKYYFIMGIDNALNIDKWQDKEKSLNLLPFIIVPRPNYILPNENMWFMKQPHIFVNSDIWEYGSSTKAREEYKIYKDTSLLDPNIIDYIKNNKLYNYS